MMNVQYTLDNEGGIDPIDPLGDLTIMGDNSSSLLLIETFIDVWLLSLLRGLLSISNGKSIRVEVLEEPCFILMTEENGFLHLECDGKSIRLQSGQARKYFIEAAKMLVNELSKYNGVERNATIAELKALILR